MAGDLVVDLRGRRIETLDDFWDAVAVPCGLPPWFGRNLDAWADTLQAGGISELIDDHDALIIHVDRRGWFSRDNRELHLLKTTFTGHRSRLVIHDPTGAKVVHGPTGGEVVHGSIGGEITEGPADIEVVQGAARGEVVQGPVDGEVVDGPVGGEVMHGPVGSEDIPGPEDVEVILDKYTGRPHRKQMMRRLGQDEHGTWLVAPAGTVVHSVAAGRDFVTPHLTVRLVPVGQWWNAIFFARPSPWDVYCDVVTPPAWPDPGTVVMTDLDLDVQRARDGRVVLLDEDEFQANAEMYAYPADLVTRARATAEHLTAALTARAEPFGTAYQHWLRVADDVVGRPA
ncbi:DUF402 domain-containing protein [Actinoplanes sp. Pm04-4]|uniref:DUF402 domain-containing protein n=1 Tax=Paractinoplanes pyxinae TaxID=2997416 RepID=A0ABT4AVK6_9ACTN|nr:DUF402 domain-containing protein [Actinoplanes pyxinae]MCY1138266.1 DUF402 domain-containing protein [Actinoplanes pyxinae]